MFFISARRSMVFVNKFLLLVLIATCAVATVRAEDQAACRVPPGSSSNLSVDNGRLCLDEDPAASPEGQTIRTVGYGIVPVTIDDRWRGDADCNSNCDPEANTCASAAIKKVL